MRKILFIYFFSFCFFNPLFTQNTSNQSEKISPALSAQAATGATDLDFIIILDQQADLSAAATKADKVSKGAYVLSKLQATASQTQTALVDFLNQESMPYQTFYVVNAIKAIGNGDRVMRGKVVRE